MANLLSPPATALFDRINAEVDRALCDGKTSMGEVCDAAELLVAVTHERWNQVAQRTAEDLVNDEENGEDAADAWKKGT